MRSNIQNSHKLQFALAVCAGLTLFVTPARANTMLTLGSDPVQLYRGINIPPYPASVTVTTDLTTVTTTGLLVFCLSETKTATWGGPAYEETTHTPSGPQEEEAAFLAAYSLYLGAPKSSSLYPDFVTNVEGPIAMAIWEIMGGPKQDSNAIPYIQLAESVYRDGLIPASFLASVQVYMPTNTDIQPFMTAVRNDAMILDAVPEPGTWIFLVSGVALMALGRRRSRA